MQRTMKPKTIREKYSGGPKAKAASASGGARKTSPKMAMVPAMNEPMAQIASAGPGPSLLGHLIAVNAGDHRGGFTRHIQGGWRW